MSAPSPDFSIRQPFALKVGQTRERYTLPAREAAGARPVSRNLDGRKITEAHDWQPHAVIRQLQRLVRKLFRPQ